MTALIVTVCLSMRSLPGQPTSCVCMVQCALLPGHEFDLDTVFVIHFLIRIMSYNLIHLLHDQEIHVGFIFKMGLVWVGLIIRFHLCLVAYLLNI